MPIEVIIVLPVLCFILALILSDDNYPSKTVIGILLTISCGLIIWLITALVSFDNENYNYIGEYVVVTNNNQQFIYSGKYVLDLKRESNIIVPENTKIQLYKLNGTSCGIDFHNVEWRIKILKE
jgi:hypothetical protein